MFFKKKEPIDVRDIKHKNRDFSKNFVPKDGHGFIDLTKKRMLPSEIEKEKSQIKTSGPSSEVRSTNYSSSSFNFFDNTSRNDLGNTNDELIKKLSTQISELDTKLYKFEQRLELLERKIGVSDPSNFNSLGW